MTVSAKDGLKLVGISVVCFCAVFVCTFFLNFYLDVLPLREKVDEQTMPLYEAQLATARMCCGVTGGVLSLIAAVMLVFYVKLYVDEHATTLGTLKALGYSETRLAKDFCIFALAVFVGCAAGFGLGHAVMPFIYKQLAVDGITVDITFRPWLIAVLIIAPTAVFALLAFAVARVVLGRSALRLMRGNAKTVKPSARTAKNKNRPFLVDIALGTVRANKLLTFFIAFSCFCFAAMVQMGASMESLVNGGTMGWMILLIGVVIALTSAFMSMTALVRNNRKTIALLKASGYPLARRTAAVFAGFVPFAVLGFAIGTAYQYGFLVLMVNVIFASVGEVPEYGFDVGIMFLTLAAFVATYFAIVALYTAKLGRVSVKEIMSEA